MTNSRRRTKMSLETAISLKFIVINLTNITGSNVRIRTGQKNKKFPLKEFFWFPVYLHFQQILSLKKIFVSKPQALFWQTKPLEWVKNSFFVRPSMNLATWNPVVKTHICYIAYTHICSNELQENLVTTFEWMESRWIRARQPPRFVSLTECTAE